MSTQNTAVETGVDVRVVVLYPESATDILRTIGLRMVAQRKGSEISGHRRELNMERWLRAIADRIGSLTMVRFGFVFCIWSFCLLYFVFRSFLLVLGCGIDLNCESNGKQNDNI